MSLKVVPRLKTGIESAKRARGATQMLLASSLSAQIVNLSDECLPPNQKNADKVIPLRI